MIYYPLSVLFLAGIRDILLITTPHDLPLFKRLLGDGSQFGVTIQYKEQARPEGIAQSFILGEEFIQEERVALILGDNIYYGNHLQPLLKEAVDQPEGATIFAYKVGDPKRYGVVEFDTKENALSIEEKPQNPKSSYAVTGLYFYDNQVVSLAKSLKPSKRGEFEITDLNALYLRENKLVVKKMGRGFTWLDMGTHESLLQAGQYIQVLEERQGLTIGSLEEVAYHQKWITKSQVYELSEKMGESSYTKNLKELM